MHANVKMRHEGMLALQKRRQGRIADLSGGGQGSKKGPNFDLASASLYVTTAAVSGNYQVLQISIADISLAATHWTSRFALRSRFLLRQHWPIHAAGLLSPLPPL